MEEGKTSESVQVCVEVRLAAASITHHIALFNVGAFFQEQLAARKMACE